MGERTVTSYASYTVFCALYLAQALWAYSWWRDRWIGKVLVIINQWVGVIEMGALCGALAAIIKMFWFSEGRLVTGISGMGWSGPPANEGRVFATVSLLAFIAFGLLVVRAPPRSALANVALFFGPGSATLVAAVLWLLLVI